VNLIKNVNEKFDNSLDTPKKSETQESTEDDPVLIQFFTKITKLLHIAQFEEKEDLTHKVTVKGRHGETSQFAFSDKDNTSGTENSTTNFFK
jgi:hypothetical protein